ncbi:putative disease resistance protein RGA1 [Pistacia vera]|uniref:putative disease resistance protein RGA1 n=1 Tax=Pistacia vera TaxID=55513 RepID=UPI001262D3A8|nr:putative disease resistance protein RGA1 [Pistacia vera]
MAGTVASPLLDVLCDRLDSHVTALSANFIQIRLKLAETQAILEDTITERGGSDQIPSIRIWLTVLRDLAYDIDVLIDDWERSRKSKATCSFPTSLNNSKIDQEVRRIHGRLVRHLNLLRELVPGVQLEKIFVSEEGSQRSDEYVVGRDFEISNVMNTMFRSQDGEERFRVIPIIGMGGIGKTVLAQRIFNDEKEIPVVKYGESTNSDEVVFEFEKPWENKRFLIVLDDVWDEDEKKIEELKSWLNVGDSGSCVLVTSRSGRVAALMGTVPAQHLKCLSDEDSWAIFEHFAFVSMQEESGELEQIGQDIVGKCRGWPLAIKSVGILLRKKNKQEWLSIAQYGLWILGELNSHLLSVLKQSYDHLPLYLKQCFAFCSLFPKDYWINKEKLVQLWIAEGFVRSKDGSNELQDIANDYFEELLQHSFFQDVVRDDLGQVLVCKMHDFMHALAVKVAGLECSNMSIRGSQIIRRYVQHCSVLGDFTQSTILEKEKLRTLLLFSGKLELGEVSSLFRGFSCLRALNLSQTVLIELPVTIGSLKHLRYLDLSYTYIRRIPESISKLKHLQTLELSNCYNLEELPKTIPQLTNLRILNIESCCSLIHMPSGIGKLKLLRKLPAFILGKRRDSANLQELNFLNLEGRLDIKNLENVRDEVDGYEAKLHEKVHIHSLGLSWSRDAITRDDISTTHVIHSLRPPQDLKVLDLKGYRGAMIPSWLNSGLTNLVKVSITDCSFEKLPPLGQIPTLKDLCIKGLSAVQIIGHDFYGKGTVRGFPSLRQLELYDMPNLWEWECLTMEKMGGEITIQAPFPSLEKLIIEGCNMLIALPFTQHLKNLALCNSNEMLLYSLSHLPPLLSLVIDSFEEFKCPPDDYGSINSIAKLTVHDCRTLGTLFDVIQSYASLRHISILHCSESGSLPVSLEKYQFLQKLDIVDCPGLVHFPEIIHLSSLKELRIEDCPNLKLSPRSIKFLDSISRLVIKRCLELERQLERRKFQIDSSMHHEEIEVESDLEDVDIEAEGPDQSPEIQHWTPDGYGPR